jgi:hypothetical protein
MVSGVNPKRRWILAIAAIVVVAGVVGFIVFREDSRDDPPRARIVQSSVEEGHWLLVIRVYVPLGCTKAYVLPQIDVLEASSDTLITHLFQVAGTHLESGGEHLITFKDLRVQSPPGSPFRLGLHVDTQTRRYTPYRMIEAVSRWWRHEKRYLVEDALLETQALDICTSPVTNAVPRAAGTPTK